MKRRTLFAVTLAAFLPFATHAADVQVAVAANFTDAAKDIATAFEKKTGNKVVMTFGSSGTFLSQIEQGAPFEVLLSADAERPAKLEADGYGVAGTRFVYAWGTLVLWSATPGFVDNKGDVLAKSRFEHLAIADPAAAPYGVAAVETLKKMGLYDALTPKIVKGSSIAQAYSFVNSGSAELGFIALSQVYRFPRGSVWSVPKAYYTPIDQQAILLKPGANDSAAKVYLTFLKSPEAVAIIRSYGYDVH
ncbi:MAG: molybdate ABC transporter substrate-binding protein [Asticcacaulis sp.]|nr:molybdate ABC transporter substrate-binding protein [Asticcacaulis sp.]